MSPKSLRSFRRSLLSWYVHHGRELPWRPTRDPYAILVSEIMLQQTQAATVVPYYNRWLRRFPTIRSVARATESDVLHAWQGLGYYTRGRNLHRCAKLIVENFGGIFPNDPDELKSLPGIGCYTANAIAVFAFDLPLPLVEANTGRVLARLFNIRDPIDSSSGRHKLWEASSKLVLKEGARDFQNAMMDLGSLICTRNPRCPVCPVRKFCRARDPASLPRKRKRAAIVPLIESHRFCTTGGAVLLEQSRQRWRGMWILPPVKLDGLKPSSSRLARSIYAAVFPFTNHRVTLRVYRQRAHHVDPSVQRWFRKAELNAIPIPSPHRHAINALFSAKPTAELHRPPSLEL
jgi:A/G-specific adenine glycosylase